jgi:hypothetical protein
MNKAFSHRARRWPLTALVALAALLVFTSPGLAAGLNEPEPAQTGALPQGGEASALVWIGALTGGVVPMRPVEFVRQKNGDLLIKGGAVVKAAPMGFWPVMRGGGQGHFFVFASENPRAMGYWLMDSDGQVTGSR